MTRNLALALLVGIAVSDRVSAQTYIWPGNQVGGSGGAGVSGNWGNARWRLSNAQGVDHAPPNSGDSVTDLLGTTAFILDVTDARSITNVTYNNASATLRIQSGGSLNASGSFTQSNGALVVDGGLTVGGALTLGGGSLTGSGSLSFGGAFNWGSGTLGVTIVSAGGGSLNGGTKTIGNGGNLTLAGGTTTITGTLDYNGTGSVTVGNGATLAIQSDIDVTRNAAYAGAAPFTIQAGGTVIKTAGGGTAQFQSGLTIVNAGTLRTSSNILEIDSNLTNSGTLTADATTTMKFVAGTLTLNAGSALTAPGRSNCVAGPTPRPCSTCRRTRVSRPVPHSASTSARCRATAS